MWVCLCGVLYAFIYILSAQNIHWAEFNVLSQVLPRCCWCCRTWYKIYISLIQQRSCCWWYSFSVLNVGKRSTSRNENGKAQVTKRGTSQLATFIFQHNNSYANLICLLFRAKNTTPFHSVFIRSIKLLTWIFVGLH